MKWTEKEKEYLRRNYGKTPYKRMLFLKGRSERAISNMAVSMGISNKKTYTKTEMLMIKTLRLSEASRILDRSENAIKIKKCRI